MGNVTGTPCGPEMLSDDVCVNLVHHIIKRTCLDLQHARRVTNKAKLEHSPKLKRLMKKEAELAEAIHAWAEWVDMDGDYLVKRSLEIADRGKSKYARPRRAEGGGGNGN